MNFLLTISRRNIRPFSYVIPCAGGIGLDGLRGIKNSFDETAISSFST